MTKEELEEEAYQYDKEHLCSGKGARWYHNVTIKEAYLAGAKPREERISELESQIEKMKCCEMCKHKNLNWGFSPICEARDKIKIENPLTCKCDKWEIKEK